MPDTGVYFVSPRSIAALAAALMLSGVSKSGSPAASEITSRPLAFRSRAFWAIAMVAEGFTRDRALARKATGRLLFAAGLWKRTDPSARPPLRQPVAATGPVAKSWPGCVTASEPRRSVQLRRQKPLPVPATRPVAHHKGCGGIFSAVEALA